MLLSSKLLLSKCSDDNLKTSRFGYGRARTSETAFSPVAKSQLNVYVSVMTYNRYAISTLSMITLVRAFEELRRHHNKVFVHVYDDASTEHAPEKRALVEDLMTRGIIQKYDVNRERLGNLQQREQCMNEFLQNEQFSHWIYTDDDLLFGPEVFVRALADYTNHLSTEGGVLLTYTNSWTKVRRPSWWHARLLHRLCRMVGIVSSQLFFHSSLGIPANTSWFIPNLLWYRSGFRLLMV